MADTKITSLLTPQVTTNPATDVLPIVNIADPLMATSGSTRKITVNQLLGAGGTATLASATITGDLTVRTNKLSVTTTGVGLGTASPNSPAHLDGAFYVNSALTLPALSTSLVAGEIHSGAGNNVATDSGFLRLSAGGGSTLGVKTALDIYRDSGGAAGLIAYIGGSTAMTLNATGLGVGGSPASKLSIFAGADGDVGLFRGGSTRQVQLGTSATAGYLNTDNGSAGLEIRTQGVARAYVDNSGNVGIGVTPSAKLHVEGGGAQGRFSVASASDSRHEYFRNSVREGLIGWDANLFQFIATQATGELALGSGNTIRVRINSAGDTISNVTGTAPTLTTNSQMVFNLTSNTNLRISVRGSDGVTRVANITLA